MAVNETAGYGLYERTAEQKDNEILYSMNEGYLRKGGCIRKGFVIEAGTVLSRDEATEKFFPYDDVGADVNEAQTLTFGAGTADAGDFKLRFTPPTGNMPDGPGPFTTGPLAFGVTGAQIQTALRALTPSLSTVTVTGSAGGPFTVTFSGEYAAQDIPLLQVVDNTVQDTPVAMALTPAQSVAAVSAGQGAVAILARGIDTTLREEHVDIYFTGVFKTEKLIGLNANAIADLGAKQDTVHGFTRIP